MTAKGPTERRRLKRHKLRIQAALKQIEWLRNARGRIRFKKEEEVMKQL